MTSKHPKWTLTFKKEAEKEFGKLDPPVRKRILKFLEERVIYQDDPRVLGKTLMGPFKDLLRYRVGDYRIICQIRDQQIVISVIHIAHRKEVYKGVKVH